MDFVLDLVKEKGIVKIIDEYKEPSLKHRKLMEEIKSINISNHNCSNPLCNKYYKTIEYIDHYGDYVYMMYLSDKIFNSGLLHFKLCAPVDEFDSENHYNLFIHNVKLNLLAGNFDFNILT